MKVVLVSFVVLFFSQLLVAQGPHVCSRYEGVYCTEEAFLNKKFDDSICTDFNENFIRVRSFNRLVMIENKVKKVYKSNTVYAYQYKGNICRYQAQDRPFDEYGYFYVKDTTGLMIYTQRSGGKYGSSINYYYSTSATSKIKKLSVKNLSKDFPESAFVESCKAIVNRLTNQSEEKAMSSIMEINSLFRKHLG
jgi:hypothetical protein